MMTDGNARWPIREEVGAYDPTMAKGPDQSNPTPFILQSSQEAVFFISIANTIYTERTMMCFRVGPSLAHIRLSALKDQPERPEGGVVVNGDRT